MKSPSRVSVPDVLKVFFPNSTAPEKPISIPVHFLKFNFSFNTHADNINTKTGVIVMIKLALDALVRLSPQKKSRMFAELPAKAQ